MDTADVLGNLGLLLLVGLAVDLLGRRTRLPRVTLLVVVGFAFGPSGMGLLDAAVSDWFPLVANMALAMVGYLLGGKLTREMLAGSGSLVFSISLAQVVMTVLVVAGGLKLLGLPLSIALLFAAVAIATDPVATEDVIAESGKPGRFSTVLRGIVAVDDAWGLVVFSLVLVAAQVLDSGISDWMPLLHGGWELGGAVALGVALGLPVAFMSGRIAGANPLLLEVVGAVFLCAGLALWLGVSYLLACVVLGAVVANVNGKQVRPFEALENVEGPVIVLFFLLSGAALQLEALEGLEWLVAAYVLLRIGGRVLGGWTASLRGPPEERRIARWSGPALLSQAGVALALAVVIAQNMPGAGNVILPVVIAATIAFEILGPVATRYTLGRF